MSTSGDTPPVDLSTHSAPPAHLSPSSLPVDLPTHDNLPSPTPFLSLALLFAVLLPFLGSSLVLFLYRIITGKQAMPNDWYNKRLKKPWFTPPNWVFPIVWIVVMYPLMGLASYFVWYEQQLPGGAGVEGVWEFAKAMVGLKYFWKGNKEGAWEPHHHRPDSFTSPSALLFGLSPADAAHLLPPPLLLYSLQLLLNWMWTPIFFGERQMALGFAWIVVMVFFVLECLVSFYGTSEMAAFCLMPYMCWLCFACLLSFCIWRLNTGQKQPRAKAAAAKTKTEKREKKKD